MMNLLRRGMKMGRGGAASSVAVEARGTYVEKTPKVHVQRSAALICAYLAGDEEGCGILRDESELSYRQWYESAIVLGASVMALLALCREQDSVDLVCNFEPDRHEIFPGERDPMEALAVLLFYHLHREVLDYGDVVVVDVVPSLFDIAVSGIEELALWGSKPAIEIARVLTLGAAKYERRVW